MNSYAVSAQSRLLRMSASTEREELLVLHHQGLGIEDARLLRPGALQHPLAQVVQVAHHVLDGLEQAAHSASTWSGRTVRSGTSGKSTRTMKAGAHCTPGETPMPRRARPCDGLPEPALHQLGQRGTAASRHARSPGSRSGCRIRPPASSLP